MWKLRVFAAAVVVLCVLGIGTGKVRGQDDGEEVPEFGDQWIGEWRLSIRANYSTCGNVAYGDKRTIALNIQRSKGDLVALEMDGAKKATLSFNRADNAKSVFFANKGQHGIELKMSNAKKAKGRRVIANPDPCAIIYDVAASKL